MLRKFIEFYIRRGFSSSRLLRNLEKSVQKTEPEEQPTPAAGSYYSRPVSFTPNVFDKKILVWSGRFKCVDEIPPKISFDTMENARSRLRIRGSNLLMVLTVGMCFFYVWLGKKKQKEGDSLVKQAKEYRDKVLQEETEKKSKQL